MPNIVDINAEARDLCDANTTSYPAATLLRRINAALEKVVGWIITADGTWQFDDSNFTTNPIGTGTLQEGIASYTFSNDFLEIEMVKVKDLNGIYILLTPFDESELGMSAEEYFNNQTGMPTHYDKVGKTIKLYPTPSAASCTLIAGLKTHFKRTADLFLETVPGTPDNVSKEPGFASTYHYILSYMAAIPYCMKYKKDRVALYEGIVGDIGVTPTGMKRDIINFYSMRERDKTKRMTFAQRQFE